MVLAGLLFSRALFPQGMQASAFLGRSIGRQKWRFLASSAASSAATRSMSSYPIALICSRFSSALKAGTKDRVSQRFPPTISRQLRPFHEFDRTCSTAAKTAEEELKARKKRRRWTFLYVALANLIGFFLFSQYRDADVLTESSDDVKAVAVGFWQKCIMALPWRYLSRGWGYIHSLELPVFLRPVFIGAYAKLTGCDLEEAEDPDLTHYKNIGEFFRRSLKPGLRPIDGASPMVSPADGRVVACGRLCDDKIDEVKGITYSMAKFLGPKTWEGCPASETSLQKVQTPDVDHNEYGRSLMQKCDEHGLFECVIYLAPGDYHRFHSPCSWSIQHRRHFPGDLLSVHPKVAAWFPNLFVVNERAAYYGQWEHGFFVMGVVGATNVGSIKVPFDPALETNVRKFVRNSWFDLKFEPTVTRDKGSYFGEFNMGSTLVLIFEAPKKSQLTVKVGDRVKVGQRLIEIS